MGFTHRGPEARGCVNRVETEPSDVTDLYHGLGYVVLTTYLRPSNYSADHKRLERVPSNSSNHRRRSSRRWTSMHSEPTPFSVQLELLP